MGFFFERAEPSRASIAKAIRAALQDPPMADAATAHDESVRRTHELQAGAGGKRLRTIPFLCSVLFLAIAALAGMACDAKGLDTSAKAMFGLAATILTATLALLAGEGAAS